MKKYTIESRGLDGSLPVFWRYYQLRSIAGVWLFIRTWSVG
jgi:hypothetical protein